MHFHIFPGMFLMHFLHRRYHGVNCKGNEPHTFNLFFVRLSTLCCAKK